MFSVVVYHDNPYQNTSSVPRSYCKLVESLLQQLVVQCFMNFLSHGLRPTCSIHFLYTSSANFFFTSLLHTYAKHISFHGNMLNSIISFMQIVNSSLRFIFVQLLKGAFNFLWTKYYSTSYSYLSSIFKYFSSTFLSN